MRTPACMPVFVLCVGREVVSYIPCGMHSRQSLLCVNAIMRAAIPTRTYTMFSSVGQLPRIRCTIFQSAPTKLPMPTRPQLRAPITTRMNEIKCSDFITYDRAVKAVGAVFAHTRPNKTKRFCAKHKLEAEAY